MTNELIGVLELSPKEQLIKNAKGWVRNKYKNLSFEDMDQEIDIKVWMLEEAGEFDYEKNDWVRPAYVMTCLKNAVTDWVRKEIGYRKVTVVTDDVFTASAYSAPDEGMDFTFKTAKAAILLFLSNEDSLPFMIAEQVRELLSLMTKAEVVAINGYLETNDHVKRVATDRAVKRVLKISKP